ncbi:CRISPR-associated endonuclease Cas3'' [Sulfodiicoccus acidiphilus]|uniref:CRISPR-associated endonuclease Cas3 n=1 Tax=Sulfodiicoccus acidiphilus TaxID=1670455 RepID=A0A348B5X1_9CREN|nr:CRISPR-associated endonuclease Cas3'' [Sulfodiicoccus acidiphilus]BBD73573.1 CRISPR-associated endonuclease Cas3'' [Sulfodiicoccus acidiphilus]GGU01767.1 CRISPR-associated endonuclease Cas3'' [Sulfodiicoccus acidiphilus]
MRPCAFAGQGLVEHSIGSVNWMDRAFDLSYFSVVANRVNRLTQGIEAPVDKWWTHELTAILTVLHDVGKAGEGFQSQFDDGCGSQRSSFKLHEIVSAVFLYRNQVKVAGEELRGIRKFWAVMTVINHLNAMRGLHTLNDAQLATLRDKLKLSKYGNTLLQELSNRGFDVGHMRAGDYTIADVQDMVQWLRGLSTRSEGKLYVLFLAPLMIGDNLDSSVARERDETSVLKRRFVRRLMEVVVNDS